MLLKSRMTVTSFGVEEQMRLVAVALAQAGDLVQDRCARHSKWCLASCCRFCLVLPVCLNTIQNDRCQGYAHTHISPSLAAWNGRRTVTRWADDSLLQARAQRAVHAFIDKSL